LLYFHFALLDVSGKGMTDFTNDYNDFISKKILFVGDSHMRGYAELFMHLVCQYSLDKLSIIDPEILKTTQVFHMNKADKKICNSTTHGGSIDPSCLLDFDWGCEQSTVGYLGSMYCAPDMVNHFEGYDYIIINCGHHPASQDHYSYDKYDSTVNKLFDTFIKKNVTNFAKLIWLENTAPPLRQDHWVIEKEDWRTYHRLILFDSLAKKAMKNRTDRLDIGLIPAFYSTLALFDKMCDCAHYPSSAKVPQLLGLIDAVRFINEKI
jgi:hypothetical protein